MPSLIIVVLVLQLAVHLVNTVGAAAVNDFIWRLFLQVPGNSTRGEARKQHILQKEVLKLKREMNATSSQDEFAKWAKIRRQHDKKLDEYEKTSSSLKTFRTQFDSYANMVRWLATVGLRFFLQLWYARVAIFWMPRGMVPRYVEWVLCWPKAPMGSVSIQVWFLACTSVVGMLGSAVAAAFMLVSGKEDANGARGQKVGGGGGGGLKEKKREKLAEEDVD